MKRTVVVLCLLVAALALVDRSTASAAEGCFMRLKGCFYEAAKPDSFIDRTLMALDCELDFVECVREKVGGW
jgi:hypothetical protein